MGEKPTILGDEAFADGTRFVIGNTMYESLGPKANGDVEVVPLDLNGRPDLEVGPRVLPKDTLVSIPGEGLFANLTRAVLGTINR